MSPSRSNRPLAMDPDPLRRELLEGFAEATGLTSARPPRRYLWTDAFAVCGFLGLYRETDAERWLRTALELVDQVHRVLGRHRADDPREGWISGLHEEEGRDHPTAGGLRIGKPEPERRPDEPLDPRREWDRDGQYFHYLTRWMHALNRVWRVTGEPRFHRWAVELARAAVRGFVVAAPTGSGRRMIWKASIDLTRPLVPSTGRHDPIDGRLSLAALQVTAPGAGASKENRPAVKAAAGASAGPPDRAAADPPPLADECAVLEGIARGMSWSTDDALGIGGLLVDALRLEQIGAAGTAPEPPLDPVLRSSVLRDAARSLDGFAHSGQPAGPAGGRLAFRELGLAIGLAAVGRLAAPDAAEASGDAVTTRLREAGARHGTLREAIVAFWRRPGHRDVRAWTEHGDINDVMLAVALAPGGYLDL